ncbi:MAG TPA: polysaccharide deacetylase family protein [Polyangia bacterium]|jgi:peptidoglycan/xylan/chitin deacetylase (PgdA/CDA1 family)|nr:polysaccharide deacetylase family protein [Polyangia bacterium]
MLAAAVLSLAAVAGLSPISRVLTQEPVVAITFDACATRTKGYEFDRRIFEILRSEQIPATIFVSGRWIEAHPAEARELAADPLIEFGNHSWDHPHFTHINLERMDAEVQQTQAALARIGRRAVAFRPPFGDWSPRVVREIRRLFRLPTVMWDVVSGDPSKKATTDGIISEVLEHTQRGSIIIFHINGRGWHTAEALPRILSELRARGLRFVPLSELLKLGPPVAADPNG